MLKWENLFLNGSVIDLQVSLWRARLQLKPADLGLESSPEVHQALSLGCHRLAPHEAFEGVLAAAHKAENVVHQRSMDFPLVRGARFVPAAEVTNLVTLLTERQWEFDSQVDMFLDRYEDIKRSMLPVLENALMAAARDPVAARRAFERVCAEYPDAREVRRKFGLSWKVYAITGIDNVVVGAVDKENESVRSILSSMMRGLRQDLSGRVAELMELAAKGGKLNKRTVDTTLALCNRLDNLNIMQDQTLREQVGALRRLIQGLEGNEVGMGTVAGFAQVKAAITEDMAQAVAAAERNLTAVGRRQLKVA